MTDIRDAVNAGRTVTMHEKIIQYKEWHGSSDKNYWSSRITQKQYSNFVYIFIMLITAFFIIFYLKF